MERITASEIQAMEGMDANAWAKLRQMQEQFQNQRQQAAQGGHGDTVEMTDSGGPGAQEQSFRDAAQNLGVTRDELEGDQELPQAGSAPLLGAEAHASHGTRATGLLGSQDMSLKGAANGGRPYRIEMVRTPNHKSPTGYSWAIKQVYSDGRP